MAKDGRALREEAAAAVAAGKHKRALAAYLELERIEANDAQWPKRAGETYRRLGNPSNAIEAFERSADRYAQNGFLVQAIAVCKVILQIKPNHADTLRRIAEMNQRIGASQTRGGRAARARGGPPPARPARRAWPTTTRRCTRTRASRRSAAGPRPRRRFARRTTACR